MLFLFATLFPSRFPQLDFIFPQSSTQSASKARGWQVPSKVKLLLIKRFGPSTVTEIFTHSLSRFNSIPKGSLCAWIANSLLSKVGSVEKPLIYLVLRFIIIPKTCLETIFFQHLFLTLLLLPVLFPQIKPEMTYTECLPACRHCSNNFICLTYLL